MRTYNTKSFRVMIARCAGKLQAAGWEPVAIRDRPLRLNEHCLRLSRTVPRTRTVDTYTTPIMNTPLDCWQRAVADLLGEVQ